MSNPILSKHLAKAAEYSTPSESPAREAPSDTTAPPPGPEGGGKPAASAGSGCPCPRPGMFDRCYKYGCIYGPGGTDQVGGTRKLMSAIIPPMVAAT